MKSFFSLFTDSAKSLKDLRTLTTTAMLIAIAVVIRSLGIQITADVRIVFTCIPIAIIGMLFGPIVCGMSAFSIDFIGFLIADTTGNPYSIQLGIVKILVGILYGVVLYRKEISYENGVRVKNGLTIALARGSVMIVCDIILNSYFIYTLYVNKNFSLIESFGDSEMMKSMLVWISPRVIKNLVQYPIDVVLLLITLPVANTAYRNVKRMYNRA